MTKEQLDTMVAGMTAKPNHEASDAIESLIEAKLTEAFARAMNLPSTPFDAECIRISKLRVAIVFATADCSP